MFNSHKNQTQITFEQVPNAISALLHKVAELEQLLHSALSVAKPTREMLKFDDACKFLGMPKSTLYSKVQNREIAYSKPGKHLLFSLDDLMDYQKRNRRKTKAEIQAEVRKGVRNV